MAFVDLALKRLEALSLILSNIEDRPDYNKPEISRQHDEYLRLFKHVNDRTPERLTKKHYLNPITKIQTQYKEQKCQK